MLCRTKDAMHAMQNERLASETAFSSAFSHCPPLVLRTRTGLTLCHAEVLAAALRAISKHLTHQHAVVPHAPLVSMPTHALRTFAMPCRCTGCCAEGNQQAPHSSACSRSSCAPCINAYSHAQDSRYAKQKYWLQRCGLSRIMYLIEGDPATDQNLTDGEQPRHIGRFSMMSACDPISHMFDSHV